MTTTNRPARRPPAAACRCTWDIQPRTPPVRLASRDRLCPLHREVRGEPQQPMHTGSRVPIL